MNDRTCQWPGCERPGDFSRGLCQRCNMRARRAGTLEQFSAPPRTCGVCGASFTTGPRLGNLYCSVSCQREGVRLRRIARREGKLTGRRCTRCREEMPLSMRSDSNYCSVACQQAAWYDEHDEELKERATEWRVANPESRRESHLRRRARKAGVAVQRLDLGYVWSRDRGLCWICGAAVDRELRWPDSYSPTLDHVIPLAKGGSHVLGNVALAHARCNMSKKDKVLPFFPPWWEDEGVMPDESPECLAS